MNPMPAQGDEHEALSQSTHLLPHQMTTSCKPRMDAEMLLSCAGLLDVLLSTDALLQTCAPTLHLPVIGVARSR
jgi:hypothetical protein